MNKLPLGHLTCIQPLDCRDVKRRRKRILSRRSAGRQIQTALRAAQRRYEIERLPADFLASFIAPEEFALVFGEIRHEFWQKRQFAVDKPCKKDIFKAVAL